MSELVSNVVTYRTISSIRTPHYTAKLTRQSQKLPLVCSQKIITFDASELESIAVRHLEIHQYPPVGSCWALTIRKVHSPGILQHHCPQRTREPTTDRWVPTVPMLPQALRKLERNFTATRRVHEVRHGVRGGANERL